MRTLAAAGGGALILIIMWEAFEALVLPRRVARRGRFSRVFSVALWTSWLGIARAIQRPRRREAFLGLFGPLSLLILLTVWAAGMIVGFGLVQWGLGSRVAAPEETVTFLTDLYLSGTTFFTLGLGDVRPTAHAARLVTVVEAGTGFGFLAMVIAYLPVLYQAFSRRETAISLLDARAGSPPSAGELLRRHGRDQARALEELLRDWERWSAELLESHLSYPVLAYYRSQHSNQSWLAALTTILDTCALVMTVLPEGPVRQARLTFAIARHAVVDLSQVFSTPPCPPEAERLPLSEWETLRTTLVEGGYALQVGPGPDPGLLRVRRLYEPYVSALGKHLALALPPWVAAAHPPDAWQTSAWEKLSRKAASTCSAEDDADEHY